MRDNLSEAADTLPRISPADVLTLGDANLAGVRMPFKRNEEIFGESEPAEYLYRVTAGAVRAMRFTADGRRQIMAFYLPGDIFGLEQGNAHALSAEAVTDCEVLLIRRASVDKAVATSLSAAHALYALSIAKMHEAHEHALVLGRKGAGERVAAFLLKLADRIAERDLDLPMSRLDIADYLALTIETVSRAFTQMEKDHAIDLPTSRHVVVTNRCALEELQAA